MIPIFRKFKEENFEIIIVDPRGYFASKERFPDTKIINKWPNEAFDEIETNSKTAMVTLTHDPKIDDPALLVALNNPLFSISCLGSKKTHASRKARLHKHGISEEQLSKINGPAGLDINAKNPAEIAVSIMAELIKDWRSET